MYLTDAEEYETPVVVFTINFLGFVSYKMLFGYVSNIRKVFIFLKIIFFSTRFHEYENRHYGYEIFYEQ